MMLWLAHRVLWRYGGLVLIAAAVGGLVDHNHETGELLIMAACWLTAATTVSVAEGRMRRTRGTHDTA